MEAMKSCGLTHDDAQVMDQWTTRNKGATKTVHVWLAIREQIWQIIIQHVLCGILIQQNSYISRRMSLLILYCEIVDDVFINLTDELDLPVTDSLTCKYVLIFSASYVMNTP